MAKIAGYILSIAGLALIVLSSTISKLAFMARFGTKALLYPIIGAVVLIAIGVVLVMSDGSSTSKVPHAAEEVPIYEGEGKKKRIIGYKRAEK